MGLSKSVAPALKSTENMKRANSLRICIISYPTSRISRGYRHLLKLVQICSGVLSLYPEPDPLYVISGNIPHSELAEGKISWTNFEINTALNKSLPLAVSLPVWAWNYLSGQIKMSWALLKIARKVDMVIFFLGGDLCLVPLFCAKITRKRTMRIVIEASARAGRLSYGGAISRVLNLLGKINYSLSDRIMLETGSTAEWLGLDHKFRKKVSNGGELFVDARFLKSPAPYDSRRKIIGYVGQLTENKGVMEFVAAIPLILEQDKSTEFLIGGDGKLFNAIQERLKTDGLQDRVTLSGWIPDVELPEYLNRLKLFVLPSYTETGVPTAVLEAMACGTPVLATAVGGITDAIKHAQTGFILKDSSPESISEGVVKALECPHLGQISKEGRKLVEAEYTLAQTIRRYRDILLGEGDRT